MKPSPYLVDYSMVCRRTGIARRFTKRINATDLFDATLQASLLRLPAEALTLAEAGATLRFDAVRAAPL